MKPLRKGLARSTLTANLREVLEQEGIDFENMVAISPHKLEVAAAVLGGAIKETCRQQGIPVDLFFRYFNHNTWDLTRTLKASGLLDKVE